MPTVAGIRRSQPASCVEFREVQAWFLIPNEALKAPNKIGMSKRLKLVEESLWECTVCTYRNKAEAFKCSMCDTRKGTSTRKPRINPQVAAQLLTPGPPQPGKIKKESGAPAAMTCNASGSVASSLPGGSSSSVQNGTPAPKDVKKPKEERKATGKSSRGRWKHVDRSSGRKKEVTVNNVTVVFTEFQPKMRSPSEVSEKSITPSPSRKSAGNGAPPTRGGPNSSSSSHLPSRREASTSASHHLDTSSGDSRSSS